MSQSDAPDTTEDRGPGQGDGAPSGAPEPGDPGVAGATGAGTAAGDADERGGAAPAADERGGAAPAAGDSPGGGDDTGGVPSVEDLLNALEEVTAERDQYLALAREKQAEFENYRKQMMRRQTEHLEQAAATLVEKVLPVLDALDSGLAHGEEALAPLHAQLLGVLEREGLERVAPQGEPFDPSQHEAVVHEPGDGGEEVVTEVMRTGYRWKGRVLRPAMVKVRS